MALICVPGRIHSFLTIGFAEGVTVTTISESTHASLGVSTGIASSLSRLAHLQKAVLLSLDRDQALTFLIFLTCNNARSCVRAC